MSLIMEVELKTLFLSTLRYIDQVDLTLWDSCSPDGGVFFNIGRQRDHDFTEVLIWDFMCLIFPIFFFLLLCCTMKRYLSFIITELMIWLNWSDLAIMQEKFVSIVSSISSCPSVLRPDGSKPLQISYSVFFFFFPLVCHMSMNNYIKPCL